MYRLEKRAFSAWFEIPLMLTLADSYLPTVTSIGEGGTDYLYWVVFCALAIGRNRPRADVCALRNKPSFTPVSKARYLPTDAK